MKGKIYHVACKKVCCKSRRSLEPTTTNQWFEYNSTYVMVWCGAMVDVKFEFVLAFLLSSLIVFLVLLVGYHVCQSLHATVCA